MMKSSIVKMFESLKQKAQQGKDNLREWVYTYLFESVSLPEVFEFGCELALVRSRPLTYFMLVLTALVYRIESAVKELFKKKK